MNKDALREELAADEGCRYEIYLDSLGLPTFGIGALVKEHDPEYGLPVGTPVSEDRVRQRFNLDIAVTIEDCRADVRTFSRINFNELDERYPDARSGALQYDCSNLDTHACSKFVKEMGGCS
jgi:hypothetical protein